MDSTASTETRRICQPGEDSDNIKIDTEFENLIPPLSKSELSDLHLSIDAEQGCHDPLVVWKGKNILVDGHNRIKRCREKGYPFPVVEREFDDRDAARAYIINEQLGRRNLSPAAESYLRGKRYLETKQQGARTDQTSGQSDQKTTAEKLGEEFKVGEKTIRRDGKFAEAVDQIITNCGQDAKNLILSRDSGLTRGMVVRLAKLKPAEQQQYLRTLKESGKRPRKAKKGKKRERLTLIRVPTQPKALVQTLLEKLGSKELDDVSRMLEEAIAKRNQEPKEKESEPTPRRKGKTEK